MSYSIFMELALHEFGNDLLRHGRGFQPRRIVRMAADQHARFERLDAQGLALEHLVSELKTGTVETLDPALDRDPVAVGGSDVKFRPRIHHGNPHQAVLS